jgi:predicted ATPase
VATTPAILRRAYSIARGKSTEIQSIYRIYQEMLWLFVSERQMMSPIYAVAG